MIRDPSDGSVRKMCGCDACRVDGIQHLAGCAVHTGPALAGGICTCAMGRGMPNDLNRLGGSPEEVWVSKEMDEYLSGLPLESTKPDRKERLDKSREQLRNYRKTGVWNDAT